MLEVDLQDTDPIVERAITESCAAFGSVTSVKMHREPSPFALIEMSRREQTYEVAAQYGGVRHFRAHPPGAKRQGRLTHFGAPRCASSIRGTRRGAPRRRLYPL